MARSAESPRRGGEAPEPGRAHAALLLIPGIALVELDLWLLRSLADVRWHALALAALAGLMVYALQVAPRPEERAPLGRPRAWLEALLGTLLLAAAIGLAGLLLRAPDEAARLPIAHAAPAEAARWLGLRLGIALGQQVALHWFLVPLLWALTRRLDAAALLAAGIFALLHLPSPWLAAGTGLAALVWIPLHRRSGLLAPLIVSHFLLAATVQTVLPARIHYGLEVGASALAARHR